ncbi:MAG: arginase family protein [Sphingosinicella sp.]|nr:arginase family protein [Sphingosinicella sp.]
MIVSEARYPPVVPTHQHRMPAVDSPGSPGFDFAQLNDLIRGLLASGRVLGMDVTIFDPDLDPTGKHASALVDCLHKAFAASLSTEVMS